MAKSLSIRLALLLALAATVLSGLLLAGPVASEATAACRAAHKPAYQVPAKRARKATLCLINKQRAKRGLSKLKERRDMRRAAKKHTRRMIRKRCFSHRCPGEGDVLGRLASTSYLPCACSWGIAENIAWGGGRRSKPRQIVRSWMRSSGHRANILNRSYEHIGIGVKPRSPSGARGAATYTTTFGFRR